MHTSNYMTSRHQKLKKQFIKKMRSLSPHQKQMILEIANLIDRGVGMAKTLMKHFTLFLTMILIGTLIGLGFRQLFEILNLEPQTIQTPLQSVLEQNAG